MKLSHFGQNLIDEKSQKNSYSGEEVNTKCVL